MPTPPPPIPTSGKEEFRPENFQRKSGFRDYLIYGLLLVLVFGPVAAVAYYYTRPPAEQIQLRARIRHLLGKAAPDDTDTQRVVRLKQPNLEGLSEAESATPAPAKRAEVRAEASSAYAGGGPTRVLPSKDPRLPEAGAAFLEYAQAMKVNGVLPGNPAKVMVGGHQFRVGEIINPDLGVTLAGVDSGTKFFVLRDKTGAELRVSY